jgi:hypothetical protein
MLPICYLDHESVIPSLFFALLKVKDFVALNRTQTLRSVGIMLDRTCSLK